MPILPSLRINPVATINSSNIFVLPQGYAFPAGPVTITEISLRRGSLFRLIPTPLGTDFYFPFIPNNVGSCVVNHPFNGQIVTTLALSGCAIEVLSFPSLNRYVFYHDSDGRNMYRIPPTNRGAQVCRIQSGSYWDNYGLYKTAAPNVQFIFVYYNNAWHVGAFGVYTKYVHPSVDIIKTFTPKGGKYRGFFNDRFRLLQL